jgi:Tfp pilus assembly protein PilV
MMRFIKGLKSRINKICASNDGLTMVEVIISFVIFMLSLVMVTVSLRYALTTQVKYAERKEWINMLLVNMYAEKATDKADIVYSKDNIDFKLRRSSDNTEPGFDSVFSGGDIGVTARYSLWNVKFDKIATQKAFGLISDSKIEDYSWYQNLDSSGDGQSLTYYDYNEADTSNWSAVTISLYGPKKN